VDLQLIKKKAKNEPVKNPIINVHN